MSYYPKQYPVLDRTEWQIDRREEFDRGTCEDAVLTDNGPQVAPGKREGVYTTQFIDAGCAVQWSQVIWEAELPLESRVALRTRFGATEDECSRARWSALHRVSPGQVVLAGSREMYAAVAAARFLQVRAELTAGTGGSPTLRKIRLTAKLPPPACVAPMDHSVVGSESPVFYWTRVEGAAGYSVEVSRSADFSADVLKEHGITDTSVVLADPLEPGEYYWRVRAIDGTRQVTDYSPARRFTVGSRKSIPLERLTHPYLFFTRDDMPAIRERLMSRRAETYRRILAKADAALEAELPDEKDVLLTPGQHSGFHPLAGQVARGRLEPLAFAYLFTEQEKYAAKARELALHLAGFSRWTGVPFGDPNFCYPVWQAALETAGMCKGVATAYDWLYHYLSEDDRAAIREGLLRLGILPIIESWTDPRTILHIPRHQLPAGNWWAVCNSGAGIAALAVLCEVSDAKRWAGLAADAIRAYLCYPGGDVWNVDMKAGFGGQYMLSTYPNWGEDGGYIESLGYVNYGLVNAMYFVDAAKRVMGEDLAEHVNPKLIDQALYCTHRGRDGQVRVINFNDSGSVNWTDDLYALLARHRRCGRAKFLLDYGYPELEGIHAVLADEDGVEAGPPDASRRNKFFRDIGWCVFRSGWESNSSLMAAKFTLGRGHQDIGQFVIHYQGHPFIVDPGVLAYSDPIYQQHLRTSHAHNLVLVDDQCQMPADGTVLGFAEAPGIGIVEADLTAAYQDLVDVWRRTLIYLEPECFVVIDALESDRERSYSWQIHPCGRTAVQPGVGATIHQDDYEMQLRLLSPSRWRVGAKQGYIGAEETEYHAFCPERPCREVVFVAVFAGAQKGRNIGVEKQEKDSALGVRVLTADCSHVVLLQPRKPGPLSGWGVEATGTVCAVSGAKSDGRRRWAIAGTGPLIVDSAEVAPPVEEHSFRAGVMQ